MATRTLTILLADLVGSSTHLTTIPQKQAVEYLQDATLPIREIIEDYGGNVIKFTGDGYLAAFDCIAYGLRAAERIQHHFLRQTHTPTGISLDGVRVILNTADVTVQDDDIMGDGVALVSRLEKDVPTNQVYVTAAIEAVADDAEFRFEPAGEMRPRGWHRPVRVYQLLSTDVNFVEPNVFLLITDLHGLIRTGESLPAGVVNQWLLTWGDMHRQAAVGLKGRVRQFIADMALVTFTNAEDALQCVTSLRALAAQHDQTHPDLPKIEFAAVISTGDLILSPTGVVGRPVNQAFRVLHASPRKTITIDAPVFERLSSDRDRFMQVTRIDRDGVAVPCYELVES
jgi:class 3 adenylate cyclase